MEKNHYQGTRVKKQNGQNKYEFKPFFAMTNFIYPFKIYYQSTLYRKERKIILSRFIVGFLLLLGCSTQQVLAQNYTISTFGALITITDVGGIGETMTVSEVGSSIRFVVSGRTYSLNGGPTTAFNTTPADVALAGKTLITINAGAGNDVVNIGGFATTFPNLIVNGGIGDDNINFTGNITFGLNYSLNANLQNDDANPGIDNIRINGADLRVSGTGSLDF